MKRFSNIMASTLALIACMAFVFLFLYKDNVWQALFLLCALGAVPYILLPKR